MASITTTSTGTSIMPISDKSLRVERIKDTLEYPALYLDIYVCGPAFEERAFAEMFARSWCNKVSDPRDADLILFPGGSDVDPVLYGEFPHHSVYCDPARDKIDVEVFNIAVEYGIPMFGVCRGAQLGWVMNGGKLFQDIDNHNGEDHSIWDLTGKTNKFIRPVSSVHHQLVRRDTIPAEDFLAIAEVAKSQNRWMDGSNRQVGLHQDLEVFFLYDTCFLGVQGHPEYPGYNYFTWWCLSLIEEYIVKSEATEYNDIGQLRLTPEFMEAREEAWEKAGKVLPKLPEMS